MKQIIKKITPDYREFGLETPESPALLTCMIHDTQPERSFPSLIVVPGGGYERCSKREGESCAVRFYSYGFNAYVLEYSVINKRFPTALIELCEAVRYIKENAAELCSTDKLFAAGFSAGGHLAGCLGVFHNSDIIGSYKGNVTPDGLILCYPVISSGIYAHKGSVDNIAPDDELKKLVSIEDNVTDDFPKTFLWHCSDDKTVPVQNSLLLAQRLSEHHIPFEMHIFPAGGHAIAMCDVTTVKDENYERYIHPDVAVWSDLALTWMNKLL